MMLCTLKNQTMMTEQSEMRCVWLLSWCLTERWRKGHRLAPNCLAFGFYWCFWPNDEENDKFLLWIASKIDRIVNSLDCLLNKERSELFLPKKQLHKEVWPCGFYKIPCGNFLRLCDCLNGRNVQESNRFYKILLLRGAGSVFFDVGVIYGVQWW